MSTRYEFARSGRESSLFLIFPEGAFENLPFEVRLTAPWVGCGFGLLGELKHAVRWQFQSLGYVILREAQHGGADQVTVVATPSAATLQNAA